MVLDGCKCILLLSVGLIFNYNQNSNVENQAQLVENQIKNQKDNFIEENNEHHGTGSGKSAE
jgi:hypothetical protein